MSWLSKLLRMGLGRIGNEKPFNPDCHPSVDMQGKVYLKYKDEAAIRKHFKRQFDALEKLRLKK